MAFVLRVKIHEDDLSSGFLRPVVWQFTIVSDIYCLHHPTHHRDDARDEHL
jgi:hypothetical protein